MVRSVTAPSDDVVVPRPESYVSPDDYEPDGPVEIEVALPGSPPPRESLSFSAHYDDVSCCRAPPPPHRSTERCAPPAVTALEYRLTDAGTRAAGV